MPIQDRKDQALIRRAVVLFALLSAGLVILLVTGVVVVAETQERHATRSDAEARGRVVVGAVQDGLETSGSATLDVVSAESVEQTAARVGVRAVVLFDASGTVVWSTRGTLIGQSFALDDEVVALFDGTARVVAGPDDRLDEARPSGLLGNEIEVFAPVRDDVDESLVVEAYVDPASMGPSRAETLRLLLPVGVGALLLFVGLTLLAGRQLVRRVQASRRERIKLLTTSLIAVDHERRRLAHDLHDGIVQDLAAMRYVLESVVRVVPEGLPDDPRGRLERVCVVLEDELRSLRSVLGDLVPTETLGSPLPELLGTLLERLVRPPVTWSLEVAPAAEAVEPGAANLVRRIVQEGVRNAMHHARPTSVAVRVAVEEGDGAPRLRVEVEDDGLGLRSTDESEAPRARDHGSHLGVTLLRDLVRDLDGDLLLTERPGGGTRLSVDWPLPPDDGGHVGS